MLAAIRAYAASGRPLYAECGGLMYLSQGLEAEDGVSIPFLGILPARTRMLAGKKALGYVEVTLTEDSLWGRRGEVFRGHEFHYSELIDDPAADPAWRTVYALRRRRSETVEAEGFQKGAILASYTHLHYASRPAAVDHFLERVRRHTMNETPPRPADARLSGCAPERAGDRSEIDGDHRPGGAGAPLPAGSSGRSSGG